jgi:hypothetical protein
VTSLKEILASREAARSEIVRLLGPKLLTDTREKIAELLCSLSIEDRKDFARALVSSPRRHEDPEEPPLVDLLDDGFYAAFMARQRAPVSAIPTPLPGWNRSCRDDGGGVGLADGWFIAIGGATKSGKSLLALNLAEAAMAAGRTVGFVSLEMSVEQLTARFLSISSGVPVRELEKGSEFNADSLARAWTFARDRYDLGSERDLRQTMLVNRKVLPDPAAVWACMKSMLDAGCTFFVVDYLQLVTAGNEDDLYKQVFTIANHLRLFTATYKVSVIGLSQYNRATSADYSRSPVPQSLHGGSIENGVDQVLLLDHSRYAVDSNKSHLARTFLILGANRHGEAGNLRLLWDYRTLRCREGMPDEEQDWPKHGDKR